MMVSPWRTQTWPSGQPAALSQQQPAAQHRKRRGRVGICETSKSVCWVFFWKALSNEIPWGMHLWSCSNFDKILLREWFQRKPEASYSIELSCNHPSQRVIWRQSWRVPWMAEGYPLNWDFGTADTNGKCTNSSCVSCSRYLTCWQYSLWGLYVGVTQLMYRSRECSQDKGVAWKDSCWSA